MTVSAYKWIVRHNVPASAGVQREASPGSDARTGGLEAMLTTPRRDPSRNMARFYTVGLQADLLDGWAVVREWGRIGSPGRGRTDVHGGLEAAAAAVDWLGQRKRGRGYR